ncbi:fatty acid desaturase [Sinorhizobium meliloti]|nr:fatty acid desaturase [Sinorhizobium meliloti]MDX0212038.1 fatty acid desaturase [Sinorhizobium meliloti]
MSKCEESTREPKRRYRYDRRWIRDEVRQLSWIDDRGNAIRIATQWLAALAVGGAAIYLDHWLAYVFAGLIIGSRLQRLAVLMHEACHYNLFSNRRLNDIVGDILVAYPLGISLDLYRASHMRHHIHTNTSQDWDYVFQSSDPDQRFPRSVSSMAWLMVRSVLGLNALRMLRFAQIWLPLTNLHNPEHLDIDFTPAMRLRYLLYGTVVVATILLSPAPTAILGLYLVPLFIWSNLFNRIRAMSEHNGVSNATELSGTRTVIPSLVDRFFIAPYNVSYHLEHHLFPAVPGPHLEHLHKKLMADPIFREEAHVTHGYWGVFRELLSGRQKERTSLPVVSPD